MKFVFGQKLYVKKIDLFKFLLKNNINCRKSATLSSFKHVQNNHKMSNSYLISNKVLWLPSGLDLTNKNLKKFARKLKNL